MNLPSHRAYAYAVLGLFLIWGGLAYRWYTCGIKGFCGTQPQQVALMPQPQGTEYGQPVTGAPIVYGSTGGTTRAYTESTTAQCPALLNEYILPGAQNSMSQVTTLQTFLNTFEGEALTVDGIYDTADIAAVKRFQSKYRSIILSPYHVRYPTGNVHEATVYVINTIYCGSMKQ
jgi:hypothetical protein